MSEIDWSQAPEGATHYNAVGNDDDYRWYRVSADRVERWSIDVWTDSVFDDVVPHWTSRPGAVTTPPLETMLAEWRDLTARAQAAQAEADALFEHAGQCHGEICVRLAELGWGGSRVTGVVSEPICRPPLALDWWKHMKVGDLLTYHVGDGKYHNVGSFTDGESYRITDLDANDDSFPWEIKCDDGDLELWGSPDYFTPSTQQ